MCKCDTNLCLNWLTNHLHVLRCELTEADKGNFPRNWVSAICRPATCGAQVYLRALIPRAIITQYTVKWRQYHDYSVTFDDDVLPVLRRLQTCRRRLSTIDSSAHAWLSSVSLAPPTVVKKEPVTVKNLRKLLQSLIWMIFGMYRQLNCVCLVLWLSWDTIGWQGYTAPMSHSMWVMQNW